MTDTRAEPIFQFQTAAPRDVATELLVLPIFSDDDPDDAEFTTFDAAASGELGRARARQEFRAKPKHLFVTPLSSDGWQADRVLMIGVGPSANEEGQDDVWTRLRAAAASVAVEARRRRVTQIAVILPSRLSREWAARAIAEGVLIGGFEDRRYKAETEDDPPTPTLERCDVIGQASDHDKVEAGLRWGVALGSSANRARELSNEPANLLTPAAFAQRALSLVSDHGIEVEVLDEEGIRGLGMGLLLGVAQGSVEPPRLIVMRHSPPDAPASPVLGLVGKGVTFDSGGISIKPAAGMDLMKRDMSGGAAVVGAMRAIGALEMPIRVIGVVPMTENMPGGRATRPGDILTGASGQTVEILNTDAEGRLILGDALWHARQLGATHLVDVATLTGACVVALGGAASGLFGRPTSWVEAVQGAAARAGERVWPLPLYEDYREQLRSEMADLVNTGGRAGGACTAAAFLQAFADDVPWAHVDIAGTAWAEEARSDLAKGATGVMVRTLAELAEATAKIPAASKA